MGKQDRQNQILAMLRAEPTLTVSDLSERLAISKVTIRKDLTLLESGGQLIRVYGRAVLPENVRGGAAGFLPAENRGDQGKKQAIGTLAGGLVRDEDFLFLGPGYTCLEVAKNLRARQRLTILTTNVSAAVELADVPEYRLQLAPGDFTRRNGTYYVTGAAAAQYLGRTFFDRVFFTVDGVSLERGFSVLDAATEQVCRSIIKEGTQVVVCVPSTRFSKNALQPLGPLTLASCIVTDARPEDAYMEFFTRSGIRVLYPGAE